MTAFGLLSPGERGKLPTFGGRKPAPLHGRHKTMTSILHKLNDRANRHPEKMLYSFLDLNGTEIERHTYETFLRRMETIAAHLRSVHKFEPSARLLLAYPPG